MLQLEQRERDLARWVVPPSLTFPPFPTTCYILSPSPGNLEFYGNWKFIADGFIFRELMSNCCARSNVSEFLLLTLSLSGMFSCMLWMCPMLVLTLVINEFGGRNISPSQSCLLRQLLRLLSAVILCLLESQSDKELFNWRTAFLFALLSVFGMFENTDRPVFEWDARKNLKTRPDWTALASAQTSIGTKRHCVL